MRTAATLCALVLSGCGFGHRHLKILAPEQVAYTDVDAPGVAIDAVDRKGVRRTLDHDAMQTREGRTLQRPAVITGGDTLIFTPEHDAAELRLWIRGTSWLDRRSLTPVHTVTGSLRRRFANEVVFLPLGEPLDGPFELPVRDLSSPYNAYAFGDGDLLMVETTDPEGHTHHEILVRRDVGPSFDGFAGVLVTLPTPSEDGSTGVAPVLAAGPAFGWRSRRAYGPARALDTVELVISFGIGSTTLSDIGLESELTGVFNAALAGGGVRLFRIFTVQGFVNTSRFFREALEAPATAAVGLDATGLARFLQDGTSRLFRENPVRSRPRNR